MPKKRRLHRVTFLDGDSSRGIPPDCIGRHYKRAGYTPLQAFSAVLKLDFNAPYLRDNFGDFDVEVRTEVMDGKTWKSVDRLTYENYMRLYDPDSYEQNYGYLRDVVQLELEI